MCTARNIEKCANTSSANFQRCLLIDAWTSIVLGKSERLDKYTKPETPKYAIVFGCTTHSRSEEDRSKIIHFSETSPQYATFLRLQKKSNQVIDDESSHPNHAMPSTPEDKGRGRLSIMNSKKDPGMFGQEVCLLEALTKQNRSERGGPRSQYKDDPNHILAALKRKRQMSYASQLKASKNNHVAIQISSITRIVVQSFRKVIKCERCALFLMDHSTNELYFKPVGDEHTNPREIRFPAVSGVAGWVATKRTHLNIKNAYHDSRFNTEIDKQTNFRTRTILCAPVLSSKGKLFGVIQMVNKKKGDSKAIQSIAKKKKTDGEHHGYESCYEPFSIHDEEILHRCCAEVSRALEPILALDTKSAIDGTEMRTTRARRRSSTEKDMIDGKGLTSSVAVAAGGRRSSVGNLAQFVIDTQQADKPTTGMFGQEVCLLEALTKFQNRSERGGPISQYKDDPDHILAALKRKRMTDYNLRRKTLAPKDVLDTKSAIDGTEMRTTRARRRSSTEKDMIDGKGLTSSVAVAAGGRRSSVGNLAQFVIDTQQADKPTTGMFGQEVCLLEALTKFQNRSERGGKRMSI